MRLVFALAASLAGSAAWAYTPPFTTPPGITLIDVSKLRGENAPQLLWRRLGDSQGKPLYTRDADPPEGSTCYGDCAREFPPYLAAVKDHADGDWSILGREDRTAQWAYQGKPLYLYSGTDPRGEPLGGSYETHEDPAFRDPGSPEFSPKQGWRRAAFTPEKTMAMPTSLALVPLAAAGGVGFVSVATHLTVYMAPVSRTLAREWQPVQASALAMPIGHFSIVVRQQDGTRQWAYYGEALYTYQHDNAPGEVALLEANKRDTSERDIRPALAYRDFLPVDIELHQYPGRGPLMTTRQGRTLYTVARFHATYGGLEALGGYTISYNELKSQGTIGCQARCTQTWKPVRALRDARPSGFWEIIQRTDGTRQWMFKGTPVYTYVGDRKAGDIDGNNRYVIAYGGANGEPSYADASSDPRTPAPHIGDLSMAAAVGAKPGEQAVYVAGRGYFAQTSDGGGRGNETPATAATAATPIRFPDHGAGFYWHAIQPSDQR